jgi:hypothetical protein
MGVNIKTTVEEFLNEERRVNEIFGWSKKEKEIKEMTKKISDAKKEIDSFNPYSLCLQPGKNDSYSAIERYIDERLKDISQALPTLKEIMPEPFNTRGKDYMTTRWNLKGETIVGISPTGFSFLFDPRKLNLIYPKEECRSILKKVLDNHIARKGQGL